MKRRLGLVGQPTSTRLAPPRLVRLGAELVSVSDTGDGSAADRFAALLCDAGASPVDPEDHPVGLRIVVRAPLPSLEARARAEVLEEGADVVLGSVRPAFALLLAAACAPGVTS